MKIYSIYNDLYITRILKWDNFIDDCRLRDLGDQNNF